MTTTIPVDLRPLTPGDNNFILNSWMESYREYVCGPKKGDVFPVPLIGPRAVKPGRYYAAQQRLISALSEVRQIVVACDPTAQDFILGWICGDAMTFAVGSVQTHEYVVDFVYVKAAYRKAGLARTLLERGLGWRGEPITATHWTVPCYSVAHRYKVEFDDYLLKAGSFG